MSGAARGAAGHRVQPHTADVIVEAWGPSRAACLEELVRGFVASFAEIRPDARERTQERPVALQPRTDEEAAVQLLDEVLYLLDADGLVVADVALDERGQPATEAGDGNTLTGRFRVVPAEAVDQTGAVPKGISRSELELARARDGWRCRVVVDV